MRVELILWLNSAQWPAEDAGQQSIVRSLGRDFEETASPLRPDKVNTDKTD